MSSGVKFSKEQLQAVHLTGNNILVSASAGSGKTTVLVERIINKLLNDGITIDELLIVTFTEASAKEMKKKLRVKLSDLQISDRSNSHLRKQLMLLANANISTFHAFCNGVIQKFFYLIDVESKYQIAQDIELFLIKDEVLEALFERLYELNDPSFLLLVNRFTGSRSDMELKKVILGLYNQLRNIPYRKTFLKTVLSNYQDFTDLNDFAHSNDLFNNIQFLIEQAKESFHSAFELANQPEVMHAYHLLYEEDRAVIDVLMQLLKDRDYDKLYDYLSSVSFKTFSSKALDTCDFDTKEYIKILRDKGKDYVKALKSTYFHFSQVSQIKFIKENEAVLKALFYIVDLYEQAFVQAKRDRSWVDFSDLEELTLKIFSFNDFDNDAIHYYKKLFKEILVDEYQDTNSMQETIIQAISNQKNIFTVGDVKQSIYRFRNAEPEIFQKKYKSFSEPSNDAGVLINLNANYRSRKEVIDFINYVFSQVMDEEVGEILYDDLASLKVGKADAYPPLSDPLIHLTVIKRKDVLEDVDEHYSKLELEAHHVAQKMRQLIDEEAQVLDEPSQKMRTIRFNDMVILSRSVKNEQPIFNDVFKQYNIPLLTTDISGYFDSIEVLTVTSLLEIIDNPLQDIPLVAVLRSPFGKINEKELIEIKVNGKAEKVKSGYFYDDIQMYLKTGRNHSLTLKLKDFLTQLDAYRELSKNKSLQELLFDIYHKTNYYDFVKGQIAGKQRQANLDLLYERSKEFQNMASNSLFKFVHFIHFLKENDKDLEQARTMSENEDLVRFMSIHKSKGLEFPVVFVINLSKKYNTMDETNSILFDKDLGIAFAYSDLDLRVSYSNLYQAVIKEKIHRQMLAEEMRLLYVALTRAKERLYLVSTLKDLDNVTLKYRAVIGRDACMLPASIRVSENYLELLIMSLMRHPHFLEQVGIEERAQIDLPNQPHMSIEIIENMDFQSRDSFEKVPQNIDQSPYFSMFEQRLNYHYPNIDKTRHFAKLSIGDIKRVNSGSDFSFEPTQTLFKTPAFIDQSKAMDRGTSYHKFMQHLDYNNTYNKDSLQELKVNLVIQDILTEESVKWIDVDNIMNYLEQPLIKTFKEAISVKKELPFTTLVDAKTIYPNYPLEDDVLVQGIMDLVVVFHDKVFLLDFKTDRIDDTIDSHNRIKKMYHTQLLYYKNTVKNLYPKHKVETLLYLFEINGFISMD